MRLSRRSRRLVICSGIINESPCLTTAMIASVGYGSADPALLGPTDDNSQTNLLFKPTSFVAGEAIGGSSSTGDTAGSDATTVIAVPEPSIIALACVGLAGFAALKLRR